mgnify:CR=1 FL=1
MKTEAILQLAGPGAGEARGSEARPRPRVPGHRRRGGRLRGRAAGAAPRGLARSRIEEAEFLITEGGENILDDKGQPRVLRRRHRREGAVLADAQTTGTPGHGSRPIEDSALNRLVRALDRDARAPHAARRCCPPSPSSSATRRRGGGAARRLVPRPGQGDPGRGGRAGLYDDREVSALLRNTISITIVRAGYKTNVIPGTAEAELDVRLLPGEDPTRSWPSCEASSTTRRSRS